MHTNGELKYRGTKNFHIFNPNEVGSYEFVITAVNLNGSTEALKTISAVIVGPSKTGFWDVGMNWEYQVDYTPASSRGTHTMTMTTLGTEIVSDAFGIDQQCFLMKVVDDYDSDDQVRYYYIDTDNLMKVKWTSKNRSLMKCWHQDNYD